MDAPADGYSASHDDAARAEDGPRPGSEVAAHGEVSGAGRWSQEEHEQFVAALGIHGRDWKKISEHVTSRTVVQIRTHAQKYFQKLAREEGIARAATVFGGHYGSTSYARAAAVSLTLAQEGGGSVDEDTVNAALAAMGSGVDSVRGDGIRRSARKASSLAGPYPSDAHHDDVEGNIYERPRYVVGRHGEEASMPPRRRARKVTQAQAHPYDASGYLDGVSSGSAGRRAPRSVRPTRTSVDADTAQSSVDSRPLSSVSRDTNVSVDDISSLARAAEEALADLEGDEALIAWRMRMHARGVLGAHSYSDSSYDLYAASGRKRSRETSDVSDSEEEEEEGDDGGHPLLEIAGANDRKRPLFKATPDATGVAGRTALTTSASASSLSAAFAAAALSEAARMPRPHTYGRALAAAGGVVEAALALTAMDSDGAPSF